VYCEHIQKLVHGLQTPTVDNFLTIVFCMGYSPIWGLQLEEWNSNKVIVA